MLRVYWFENVELKKPRFGRPLGAFLAMTAVLALAALPVASAASPPAAATASAVFRHLLHGRYGAVRGFWACPSSSKVVGARTACLAEVQVGDRWHQTSALAGSRGGHVTFSQIVDTSWMRHWWPYSRHFISRSDEPQVPGVISVNSPAYDWGLVAKCAASHLHRCSAYAGKAGSSLRRIFLFTCSSSGGLVSCVNSLGDAMRYQPAR